jgi:hypothetical protein
VVAVFVPPGVLSVVDSGSFLGLGSTEFIYTPSLWFFSYKSPYARSFVLISTPQMNNLAGFLSFIYGVGCRGFSSAGQTSTRPSSQGCGYLPHLVLQIIDTRSLG